MNGFRGINMKELLGEFRYIDKIGNVVIDDGSGLRAFVPDKIFDVKEGEVVSLSIDKHNIIKRYEVVDND